MLQGTDAGAGQAPAGRDAGGRIEVLDGLRLVAALAVVVYHLMISAAGDHLGAWQGSARDEFGSLPARAAEFGWLGVQFFFLISGFVICMSSWGRTLSQFLVSRIVRIYPAYWFVVLAGALVATLAGTDRRPRSFDELVANLTMMARPLGVRELDPVFWSLWAELRFYLLFVLVVLAGVCTRHVLAFCLAWMLLSVVAIEAGSELLQVVLVAEYAPYFIAGIAFYLIRRNGSSLPLWLLVAFCWAMAQHHLAAQVHAKEKDLGHGLADWVAVLLITAAFGALALVATDRLSWLRGRWLTVAGALTYPLYLVHKNLGTMLIDRLSVRLPGWPLLVGVVVLMLALAHVVHRFVERPLAGYLKPRLVAGLESLVGSGREQTDGRHAGPAVGGAGPAPGGYVVIPTASGAEPVSRR